MTSDNSPATFLKERLRLSAVKLEDASYAGIEAMTVAAARAREFDLPRYASDGFLIPYANAAGKPLKGMWRWRNSSGNQKYKYIQPAGTGCWLYFPRVKGLDWRKVLATPKFEVFIVEGELKALSLTCAGVPAVALGGVWNYLTHKALLPELKQLAEGGRPLWIAFDSDTEEKVEVKRARWNLAKQVLDERAEVHWLVLPHIADPASPAKTGADDLVRVWKMTDNKLEARLKTLAADDFAIQQHLLRMNADYVFNLQNARVYATADTFRSWDDLTFARVIENASVVVGQKIGKGGKLEDVVAKLGRAWLDCPARNVVEGQVYEPQAQDALRSPYVTINERRYLNTWTGWASEPKPDPEGVARYWTRLLDHLFQAQGHETEKQKTERERARRWLEMWFAYPVQHPQAKLYSCAVLLGAQGGGKTLLGTVVGWACYGQHFTEITQDQLDSRFNASWAANRSFVMGSEVTSVVDHKLQRRISEILKNWITGEEIALERKGKDVYSIKNVINLYFTANKSNTFFLEDDDRRYFIWEVPNVRLATALGQPWMRAMDSYIRSPEGQAAIHHHLLKEVKIDAQLFDPKGSPPTTDAKRNAREYSQNRAEHWIDDFVERPEEYLLPATPRGERVFRQEEVYKAFLHATNSEPKSWPMQTFLRIFRTRFQTLGRASISVFEKKVKTEGGWRDVYVTKKSGIWVHKPRYNGEDRFMTLAEARNVWKEQVARRKLHPERIRSKLDALAAQARLAPKEHERMRRKLEGAQADA